LRQNNNSTSRTKKLESATRRNGSEFRVKTSVEGTEQGTIYPAVKEERADLQIKSQINGALPPGISLVKADDFEDWLLDIKVLDDNPLYRNQTYRLKFKFSSSYPIGM